MGHHLYITFPQKAASPRVAATDRGHKIGRRTLSKNSEFDRSRSASDLEVQLKHPTKGRLHLEQSWGTMGHLMGVKEPE